MRKSIYSNAKINIGLNILAKNFNGYHKLDMLMVPISLADKLEINFKNIKGNLKINCDNKNIPTDEKNIIYKIYNKFYEATQLEKEEVEIYLYKRIPNQAGLGGGSSNGAFFLKELNKYYNNVLSEQNMIDISKEIGADIPFFIKNLPCRVEGIGEKLTEIKNNLEYKILLIKPSFGISTKRAYYLSDKLMDKKEANIEILIKSLKDNNLINLNLNNKNILEQSLLTEDKNIINFRKKLDRLKNYNFFMSGSGSCYYSLLPKEENICIEELKKKIGDCDIYICNFL